MFCMPSVLCNCIKSVFSIAVPSVLCPTITGVVDTPRESEDVDSTNLGVCYEYAVGVEANANSL